MGPRPSRDFWRTDKSLASAANRTPEKSLFIKGTVTSPNVISYISDVIPCRFVDRYKCFGGICCFHLLCRRV